jgi:hypothetical protein
VGDKQLLAERFQTALDLWATGVILQRQLIRREHPGASHEEVAARLDRWLQHRPGAEWGDGPRPDAW